MIDTIKIISKAYEVELKQKDRVIIRVTETIKDTKRKAESKRRS